VNNEKLPEGPGQGWFADLIKYHTCLYTLPMNNRELIVIIVVL